MQCLNELVVSKPYIYYKNDKCRLSTKVRIDNNTDEIFYEVSKSYKKYLVNEVSDCFLIGLLLFAMENKYNLVFEGDISEDLYYNVKNRLMMAIKRNTQKYSEIDIKCKRLVSKNFNGKHNGTGLSCGVDSFYTIMKNNNYSKKSRLNIDSFTFFNVGSHGDFGGKKAMEIFEKRLEHSKDVADGMNVNLISINSNISDFIKQDFLSTATFRSLSAVFALGKYFKKYYFSSGHPYEDFCINDYDNTKYDLLVCQLISTSYLNIDLYGAQTNRLQKLSYISKYDVVKSNLDVCIKRSSNCSICNKCRRTMLELYVLDEIDNYRSVFDVDYFHHNKKEYIYWLINNKNSVNNNDIYNILLSKGEINKKTIVLANISYLLLAFKYKINKLTNHKLF